VKLWWFVARASGIVAWILLAVSVSAGIVLSSRLLRRPKPAWVLDLHRFVGGLAVMFVVVHVVALLADSFVSFGVADVLVPMASTWQPGAVAWGVVALYVLLAVELTSLLMRRLPHRTWYLVHLTSYALFALATIHGLLAGTDAGNGFVRWGAAAVVAVAVFLAVLRVPAGTPDQLSDASADTSSGGSGSSSASRSPVTG
jgi:predicted ferric reductase